jgi:hypothetical protein
MVRKLILINSGSVEFKVGMVDMNFEAKALKGKTFARLAALRFQFEIVLLPRLPPCD